jgi:hypothetical protein
VTSGDKRGLTTGSPAGEFGDMPGIITVVRSSAVMQMSSTISGHRTPQGLSGPNLEKPPSLNLTARHRLLKFWAKNTEIDNLP